VRRNFLLDEGDLLDEHLLRQSLDRLNRTRFFDPIRMSDVILRSDDRTGIVNIEVRLNERKKGAWNLSGPVGPASFAGPLEGSIGSRLPPWGRGIFELSTYTVSLGMVAFAQPIIPALATASKAQLFPILALRRPFLPANGWLSGFSIAPQLGWRASVLSYATTQIQQRTLPVLAGDRALDPELTLSMGRMDGEAPLYCEAPRPHLLWLRRGATLGVQFLGVLSVL
jgi:outer membrane protein insertion porin family